VPDSAIRPEVTTVLICHCRAANDHSIREVARAAGATAPEDLAAACGVGAQCGGCLPAVRSLLEDLHRSEHHLAPTASV
jgi:bacterioferritin-associated ferredoxin